ncbi:MAG: hypothetical protein JXR84_04175 [Anaerolineae bacterium]|nr:hypothetical protein [Anaerolineae bacterium]
MSTSLETEIKGLKEAQARLEKTLTQLSAGGGMDAIVARATLRAHRYATSITHVDTGRLKNAHTPVVQSTANEVFGVVGNNTAYAAIEAARGGDHDFYGRTAKEEGPKIVKEVQDEIARIAREGNNG